MARRSVRILGLDVLAKRLTRLGNALPDEVQEAVDDTATDALETMRHPFNASIEGGPVPFSAIDPKQRRKRSVITSPRRRGATKGVAEASVYVQKKQSSYFRFHLDDDRGRKDDVRHPGEVGVAEKYNFLPTYNLEKWQGIKPTRQGNLPRGALRKLFRRARNSRQVEADANERIRKRHARRLGVSPDDPQVDALMSARKSRKRKRVAHGDFADIFFGVPKGRANSKMGFWQRPKEESWQLIPLVHAELRSNYSKSDKMQKAWNTGVDKAADRSPLRMEVAVARALGKAVKG